MARSKTTLTYYGDQQTYEDAREMAARHGTSVSAIIDELLARFVGGEVQINHTQVTQ